ncbi:UNVERIFIED_CONTAM: hypothetical protein GTU68_039583 [Idotea baltica]|nr:hypothetical protein [Idotea baltica]
MYRLAAHYGYDDLVWNHITMRVPGTEHDFFLNKFGLLYNEVTASNLIKVDSEGTVLEGPADVNTAGFVIHSAIHNDFPKWKVVFHAHVPDALAVTALRHGFQHIVQDTSMLYGDIGSASSAPRSLVDGLSEAHSNAAFPDLTTFPTGTRYVPNQPPPSVLRMVRRSFRRPNHRQRPAIGLTSPRGGATFGGLDSLPSTCQGVDGRHQTGTLRRQTSPLCHALGSEVASVRLDVVT